MKDLSIVQKYMVCTVNEKGVFPFASVEERTLGLVAAGLLELEMEGSISIDGRKVSVSGKLPEHRPYLEPPGRIWSPSMRLSRKNKRSRSTWWWMPITSAGRTSGSKRCGTRWGARWSSWRRRRPARPACWAGLLGKQTGYLPAPEEVRSVVEQMRAELLEDGPVCDDTAALVVLLEQVKCLKVYFSDFEQKAIREKIKAIVDTPEGKIVKDMMPPAGQPQGVRVKCPDREAWRPSGRRNTSPSASWSG